MTRRLILHIGAPKCGSTFLQRALLQNQSMLGDHDIAYPTPSGAHPGNGLAALSGPEMQRILKEYQQKTILLSHEDLFAQAAHATNLVDLQTSGQITVEILVFLRPFSEFIFGDYSQFIKQNYRSYCAAQSAFEGRSFAQVAVDRSRAMPVAGFLRAWRKSFGEQSVRVAHFRDIRSVLEDLLGQPALNWSVPRQASNPSLRMVDCDRIVAAINRGAPEAQIQAMINAGLRDAGQDDPGRTTERRDWIEALFDHQNTLLEHEFGYDNRYANITASAA